MTMEDAMIRSTVAEAVERFAAYVGTLPHAASPTPSSSSSSFSAPTGCDILIGQIHVKARWLIRMLAWVRATLDDAEEMDITEESVRHWLWQLQDTADAAEDVLDEFSHEALRLAFVGDEADAPSQSPSPSRSWSSGPNPSPSQSQREMHLPEEPVRHLPRQLQDANDAAEDVLDEFPHEVDAPTRGIEMPEYDLWRSPSPSPSQREKYLSEESVRHWLHLVGGVTATDDEAYAPSASPPEASPPPTRAGERMLEMMAVRGQVRCSSSPCTSPPEKVSAFLHGVEERIEEIASRFVEIEKPEQALKVDYRKEQTQAETINTIRTTSSVMKEPHIVGRDEELAKIKQFLLSSGAEEESSDMDIDDDHVSVTAIVGMGGLGKTTLAQLAYNDPQVNQHFQLKAWVCVSEDFDVIRLTKAMLQSLNVEASRLSELDPLHKKLVQNLEGIQRFLLVLDDVWEAENLNPSSWNLLTAPFRYVSADTKIIMTTRSSKVPDVALRTWTCDLGFLSNKDTLELFMHHAFEGRDPNLCQNLVAIGKEIARKCGGVPLAAKTLGGLLCTKDDEVWNKILDSEVWNATINQEDSIIPILRLSYLHLSAPLKRCFRYCSLFPKDHVFGRNQMIHMWMAQGYIKANRKKLMEDIGQRYIDNLLSRSFFQKDPWLVEGFQMHDLMHDLARCVSGDECYSMEGEKSSSIPSHVRHLSVSLIRDSHWTINMWLRNSISDPKSLRSFILHDNDIRYSFSGLRLPSYLYTRMEHLRVLDLGGVHHSCLPESIAHLKHLRFLRNHFVEALPESVGSMYHLQTLRFGKVSELPNSISNLHNLRHLILNSWLGDCVEYPVGMGKLTDLQTVPGFFVSPNHSSGKLGELKDMNNIRGEFAILGLENLSDVNEAKKACLHKKRNISSLRLRWDPWAASSSIDEEVLESLKPSVKLASLEISGFKGPSYPLWLGDVFTRLVSIRLEHCENCTFLPPLGQLPSLKSLYIFEASAVEYIGSEFFSGGFPQLEELTLENMDNWKSWCGAQEGDCLKLKKLSIKCCDNLQSLSLINLAAVEDMYISISITSELLWMPGNSLEVSHLQRAKTIKIKKRFQGLHIEAHLSPTAPSEDEPQLQLEDVGQREAEYMLGMCSHICRLTVKSCSNLTFLPLVNYSALKYVEISDCPQLQITSVSPQLWQLPSLQKIDVNGIHGAVIIEVVRESSVELTNVDQLVAFALLKDFSHMIRQITVKNCPNLTSLPLGNYSALEYVEISDCPRLQITSVFPQLWQLPSLQRIDVNGIHGVVIIKVVRESSVELTNVDQLVAFALLKEFAHMIRHLVITNCANLTSLPWTDLTTLEYLRISECPLFQVLDAKRLPSTLHVLCIYGNPYETEQCSRHPHFQRLKQVHQCSNEEGGEHNLYLVFRNVHDASAASKFCSVDFTDIHTLEVEWDRCTNDMSNVADAITQEVLFNLYSLCISSKRLVIRGYIGSGFAGWYADFSSKTLRSDIFHSRLSHVSLLQCSKCDDLAPLSRLPILQELYVEGASSLQSVVLDCLFPCDDMSEWERQATHTSIAFPCLKKLEFHDMPVWQEWSGTKEGDFPLLRELILKHCSKLRALPSLPPSLEELKLEACHELTSLFAFGSNLTQGLKFHKSLGQLSLSATKGTPPILQRMSLTDCPLLLAWCEGHPRVLADIPNLLINGVPVHTRHGKSIRSQIKEIRKNGKVSSPQAGGLLEARKNGLLAYLAKKKKVSDRRNKQEDGPQCTRRRHDS